MAEDCMKMPHFWHFWDTVDSNLRKVLQAGLPTTIKENS